MKTTIGIFLALISIGLVTGCSSGPSVIKGSVVMWTTDEAHINLGSNDGIMLGDTLLVFHSETPTGGSPRFILAGKVKVTKVLDKNYSAVVVIEGIINERDTVEKRGK